MKILVKIFLLFLSIDAWACSVVPKENYNQIRAIEADLITVVKVISNEQIEDSLDTRVRVEVRTWIKGVGNRNFSIIREDCSREFLKGKQYILLFKGRNRIGSLSYTKDNLSKIYNDIK